MQKNSFKSSARDEGINSLLIGFINKIKMSKLEDVNEESEKYSEIIEAYQPKIWFEAIAERASKSQSGKNPVKVATHIAKPVHPDSRASNYLVKLDALPSHKALGSHSIAGKEVWDVTGNAANKLNEYKFLQLVVDGKTIADMAIKKDVKLIEAIKVYSDKAESIVDALAMLGSGEGNACEKLKQMYWLTGNDPTDNDEFHLLAPLYATSLAHHAFRQINADRFGEGAKAARQARRDNKPAVVGYSDYPGLAAQKLGGTKPQNISQLNSERGGNNYLLASLPPKWKSQGIKPPLYTESVFKRFGRRREARWLASDLLRFLKTDPHENRHTRDRVDSYIAALIDELVLFASEFQVLEPGWSSDSDCRLPLEQQLWLDVGRADDDETFAWQREQMEWTEPVRATFARWLNGWLKPLGTGDDEHQEWQARLKRQLDLLQEELPHV
jgi:CRISPR-associated protein Csy1